MKPDLQAISIDVYPACTTISYRLPCGDLFKRQYVLYSRAVALSKFKRELRALLS